MKKIFSFLPACVVIALALSPATAHACAFCNADATGSKMSKAADAGIIAMVFIMLGMLSALGGFMWHLARREKNPLPDYNELLSDDSASDGPLPRSGS